VPPLNLRWTRFLPRGVRGPNNGPKLPVFVGRQPTDGSICTELRQFKWEELCNKSDTLRHLWQNLFSGVLKLYTKMTVHMTCILVYFRNVFPDKVGFNERCGF